ncbi:hypothetical protein LA080_006848 [Diaporthe eres]|nr:hypothetical protein LA080_006848 [Diaporthe eres]
MNKNGVRYEEACRMPPHVTHKFWIQTEPDIIRMGIENPRSGIPARHIFGAGDFKIITLSEYRRDLSGRPSASSSLHPDWRTRKFIGCLDNVRGGQGPPLETDRNGADPDPNLVWHASHFAALGRGGCAAANHGCLEVFPGSCWMPRTSLFSLSSC